MAGVTFSKKYLSRLIGSSYSDKSLAEHAAKMGVEVKEINAADVSLDITANRPDLLDAVGFARAFRNFTHKSEVFKYSLKDDSGIEIKVGNNVSPRPFISALVAKNLSFDEESLKSLLNFADKFCDVYGRHRSKLSIGIYDLDKTGKKITYDAFEDPAAVRENTKGLSFVPLGHTKAMDLKEILSSTKQGVEYGNAVRKNGFTALRDEKGVMSLIPIINAESSKVTVKTKNVLIDITGLSRYIIERAADLFAATLIDTGATVQTVRISYPKETTVLPAMADEFISIPLKAIEKQIGVPIGYNNVLSLAGKMGYDAVLIGKNIRFRLPPYRLDILNYQDIIEDVAIAYGYEFIPPIAVRATQTGKLEERSVVNSRASMLMIGMGFGEAMNSYLTSEEENFSKMLHEPKKADYVRIKNSKTQNITMLRTHILPSLLKNLGMSSHEVMPQSLFEIDMVFKTVKGAPVESYHMSCVSCGPKTNFNDIKAVAEAFMSRMGIKCSIVAIDGKAFIEGRAAKIVSEGKDIGVFGEIGPQVLLNFGIEEPCIAFEIQI